MAPNPPSVGIPGRNAIADSGLPSRTSARMDSSRSGAIGSNGGMPP
jgi:hypothetical protein